MVVKTIKFLSCGSFSSVYSILYYNNTKCFAACNHKSRILACVPICIFGPRRPSDLMLPLQPSPHRRDERPVSCYTPSSNSHLQTSMGSAGRDAAGLAKDKQRAFMPNLVNNETYGTILNTNPPQPAATSAPPLPPRNLGELRTRRMEVAFVGKKIKRSNFMSTSKLIWMNR